MEYQYLEQFVAVHVFGFLIYNFHKAKVMMGDTGSLLLGGVISSIAIYLQNPLLLIIIAIIPVIETLSVIAQVVSFSLFGKRVIKTGITIFLSANMFLQILASLLDLHTLYD